MRVVPKPVAGKIGFYAAHLPKWAQDPEAVGATPEQIAALQEMVDTARAAVTRQAQAQQAARSATLGLHIAVDALAKAGSALIMGVRAKATSDGSAVYSAALIPQPRKRSPIAAPGTPGSFRVDLSEIGSLTLRWRCKNPRGASGTLYRVWRRVGDTAEFAYLGASGIKQFVDATLPAGALSVTYRVQAMRGKKVGGFATHTVHFGVSRAYRKMAASDVARLRTVQFSGPTPIAA